MSEGDDSAAFAEINVHEISLGFKTRMRILALADIHGAYDRARQILEAEPEADLLLIAGDLTTHGTPEEAGLAIAGLRALVPRLLAVAGNMDTRSIDAGYLREGYGIGGRGTVIGSIGFFGVSGGPDSFLHTPYEVSEKELRAAAEDGWTEVATARWKVFVPHAPPHGTRVDQLRSGLHVGSTGIAEFISARQPDLVVCGHIHEAAGIDSIGKSRIVNCGSVRDNRYVVVDMADDIFINLKQFTPLA